jgi:peptidoglycan/xylan/chitin deacetylase (PgdA/CDA1 family)
MSDAGSGPGSDPGGRLERSSHWIALSRSPDRLRALHAAGHQVEAHGRWHRHALRLTPWQEWAQIAWHPRAGQRGPHLYRPPYGGHSPLTRLLAHLTGRQPSETWRGEQHAPPPSTR